MSDERERERAHDDPEFADEPKGSADNVPVFCAFDKIVDIERVVPNPRNPNKHPKNQIELLANIIKANGWRQPITVSTRSGFITKGHGRHQAAQLLGVKQVPVDYQHYDTEALEYADLIADNRLAELSDMDNTMLADLLQEIDTGEIDIALTGYTEENLEALIKAMSGTDDNVSSGEDDVPEVPEPEETITRPGDIWLLGQHRLMCGDSTNPEHVARLMDGQKARMVNTDPPYGVSYVAKSGKFEMIRNDDLTGDDLVKRLLVPAFKNMVAHTENDGAFYIWHASSTRDDFVYAMKAVGLMESQYIIWVKTQFVLGWGDYRWAHEPCFYASKAGWSPKWFGDRAQPTVWRASLNKSKEIATVIGTGVVLMDGNGTKIFIAQKAPKGKKIRHMRLQADQAMLLYPEGQENTVWEVARDHGAEHPTQKPVELARRAIENSSEPGDIVLDLFGGSGSTLMGAEMTGRACYTMELTPQYCDVIVRRWEAFTNRKAVREGVESGVESGTETAGQD